MASYWIRHRGKVLGPFSSSKLRLLSRRGRFGRSFQVSMDGQSWSAAGNFPELLSGGRKAGQSSACNETSDTSLDDELEVLQEPSGRRSSLFDPDVRIHTSHHGSRRRDRAELDDDFECDDDDETIDSDEWERRYGGDSRSVKRQWKGTVFQRSRIVIPVAIICAALTYWLATSQETWTQDVADRELIAQINSQVLGAFQVGVTPSELQTLQLSVNDQLTPMIDRLTETASAQDEVKQQLLFIARDEIPCMLKELSEGEQSALIRVRARIDCIDAMVLQKWRHHPVKLFAEAVEMRTRELLPDAALNEVDNPQAENSIDALKKQVHEQNRRVDELLLDPAMQPDD